ncbi:MAG: hypothetical protein ACLRS8_15310 [Parabacteroides merdae]
MTECFRDLSIQPGKAHGSCERYIRWKHTVPAIMRPLEGRLLTADDISLCYVLAAGKGKFGKNCTG